MTVGDFLAGRSGGALAQSSFPLGLVPADFRELLPAGLVAPLREGLAAFCGKLARDYWWRVAQMPSRRRGHV